MFWLAQAASNIALIKYMGKKDLSTNLPANSSLSYTLNDLVTTAQLEILSAKHDIWEPLEIPGAAMINLPIAAQQRYLNHLSLIKAYFNYEGSFVVKSNSNFPHSSGIASSASSFAALTKCAVLALSELTQKPAPSIEVQAQLSRQGSGSSCRSFYSPWVIWEGEVVQSVDLPYKKLIHEVVVISDKEKQVSSSEAHARVKTSPFYTHRAERAEEHLKLLLEALRIQDWANSYKICWREFQDMHQLFSTSEQPFTYRTDQSSELLRILQKFWDTQGDGPIVTMDAGPNVHLLYREDQVDLADKFKQDHLVGNYDFL